MNCAVENVGEHALSSSAQNAARMLNAVMSGMVERTPKRRAARDAERGQDAARERSTLLGYL